jgi:hypothetical protein
MRTGCCGEHVDLRSRKWREAGEDYVARKGEMRNAYEILVGKPKGKRPLGRLGHKLKENIRMDLRKLE